jgi:hypothetical protein
MTAALDDLDGDIYETPRKPNHKASPILTFVLYDSNNIQN